MMPGIGKKTRERRIPAHQSWTDLVGSVLAGTARVSRLEPFSHLDGGTRGLRLDLPSVGNFGGRRDRRGNAASGLSGEGQKPGDTGGNRNSEKDLLHSLTLLRVVRIDLNYLCGMLMEFLPVCQSNPFFFRKYSISSVCT